MVIHALELDLRPETYEPHCVHAGEREWTETNCYIDLWIELLHAIGFDPIAAAACTLSSDFEGDQWTMFKFPIADLWALYGVEVAELNVWRPLPEHVVEQLGWGRLLTIDVDAWFLPDTVGVSYRAEHQKTTLAPQMIDVEQRRLGYFHNAGYYELDGEDFDGVLGLSEDSPCTVLPPYVETVRLDRAHKDPLPDLDVVHALVRAHLNRRPLENPMRRFAERVTRDLPWLAEHDMATFHRYAFGTCRQCGANAELAATFIDWLAERDGIDLGAVAEAFRTIAGRSKRLQFVLARAQLGRPVHVEEHFAAMADAWELATSALAGHYAA